MLYQEITNNTFVAWDYVSPINDIRYPSNIGQLWSENELNSINLYTPSVVTPVPNNHQIVSTEVFRIDDTVQYVYTTEEIVPVVPTEVTKIQALRAMRDFGIWDTVKTLINANTTLSEDWDAATSIPRNDEIIVNLAAGLALTEGQLDGLFIAASQL